MYFIKRYKTVLLSILVIVSFLSIQINYNDMASFSLFSSFKIMFLEGVHNGWDFSTHDITMNFTYNLLEVLVLATVLLLSAIFRKIKLMIAAIILFVFLWLFWAFSYKGLIELDIYIMSSIPFLVLSFLLLYFLFRQSNQIRTQQQQ